MRAADGTSWAAWGRTAVRISLGAFIVALIVTVLHLPQDSAAWSVVSLGVVLGATTGQSISAAWNRTKGSVVGILCGATTVLLLGALPIPVQVVIAMLGCLLICRLFNVGAGVRLGLGLSGFFVFVPGADQLSTAGYRLLATGLGIVVALAMTVLLWPDTARGELRRALADVASDLGASVVGDIASWTNPPPEPRVATGDVPADEVLTRLVRARALIPDAQHELRRGGHTMPSLQECLNRLAAATHAVNRLHDACGLPNPLAGHLHDELCAIADRFRLLADALATMLLAPSGKQIGAAYALLSAATRGLAPADDEITAALSMLRARSVTPGAQTSELVHLFDALTSLRAACSELQLAATALTRQWAPAPVR